MPLLSNFLPAREVCLKARYAHLYANILAGEWLDPEALAAQLVDRAREHRASGRRHRTFDPKHFEFRDRATPTPAR
ncbi:MAG TPA: hypothetical protein VFS11_02615 [Gemmatimonadales bacterium]|nr:hypothetical protein [Gemmatimonadales bacterium]